MENDMKGDRDSRVIETVIIIVMMIETVEVTMTYQSSSITPLS